MKGMRSLSAVFLALAMTLALVACGTPGTGGQAPDNSGQAGSTGGEAASPVTVRIGAAAGRGSSGCEFIYQFADALAAKTDKFVIEPYPGGQFGSNNEMVTAVQGNVLQAVVFTTNFIAGVCPVVELIAIPFLFPDHKTSLDVLNAGVDVITEGFEAASLYPACWIGNGTYWTFSNKPILGVSDLKGLNIRTPATDINNDICVAYGCSLVSLATSDVAMSLQQGAIDATFGPLNIGYSSFLGSFKYMTPIHGDAYNTPECFIVSSGFLDSLSEEDRTLFLETAKEVSEGENYELFLEYLEMQMEGIIEDGVEVIPDSEELRAQIEEVLMPVKENYPIKYPDRADDYHQLVAAIEASING